MHLYSSAENVNCFNLLENGVAFVIKVEDTLILAISSHMCPIDRLCVFRCTMNVLAEICNCTTLKDKTQTKNSNAFQ